MTSMKGELVVWSLMSRKNGGFIKAHPVVNLKQVSKTVFSCNILQNVGGKYRTKKNYEFFAEQCLSARQHTFDILREDEPYNYVRGNPVKVYARQIWGSKLEDPINGLVYQNQLSGSSVIVSVNPLLVPNRPLNELGGTTIEVYSQQIRLFEHNEYHPTMGAPETSYSQSSGFKLAKIYRDKKSKFSLRKVVNQFI